MRFATTALLLFLAACGDIEAEQSNAARGAGTASQAEKDVLAANAAKDEAMIARDAARLSSFYTEDYRIIDQRAEVHDKRDQVAFMTQNVELFNVVSDELQVTMLSPDAALVTGRMTGKYRTNGRHADFVERYTGVWVRQGQRWRVKHEHGSTAPAAD